LEHLGIERLHAAVGASMGGMLSLAAAAMYPEKVGRVVSISAACSSHPTAIALRYMQRRILMADPHWNGGDYYGGPYPVVSGTYPAVCGTYSVVSGTYPVVSGTYSVVRGTYSAVSGTYSAVSMMYS
jgi:homoserine O-acetyltransferase